MKNIPLYDVRTIKNLKEMLNGSAAAYSDKAAFLVKKKGNESYQPVSYMQFKKDVDALGTMLLKLGLKNKRIALISENRYEWCVSYLATINGIGVIVPLDKELPQNEIESLLQRSKVDAVIYSSNIRKQIESISHKLNFYIDMDAEESTDAALSFRSMIKEGNELIQKGDTSFINASIDNDIMSILLFTSGTTDISKAVMLSHSNICANLMSMCSMLFIGEKDTFLSVLPLHHTYECTCGFLCQIYRGSTIAFSEGLRHIPKNLQESKTTVMNGVPLIFETMYKRIWDQAAKNPSTLKKLKIALPISNFLRKLNIDLTKKLFTPIHDSFGGHIRLFISGAAGIDPIVAKGFRDFGIHIVQGYGLTECSPIVALNRDVDFKDSAAGIPLPNLEVKIVDQNSDGIGEITVKGPSVMLGYYKEDSEVVESSSAKALKDGWFHTGDLGYMDDDKFIYITGRKKNVIVTKNGKNIYPEEIETLLNRSAYIKESMVYGKDEGDGDTVVSAVIVPDMEKLQEDFKDTPLTSEAIYGLILNEVKAVNKTLIIYKHVKNIHIRENEFVKTTTRKIKRHLENKA